MACGICGQEGPLDQRGFCEVCAEKLNRLSTASSTFRAKVNKVRNENEASDVLDDEAAAPLAAAITPAPKHPGAAATSYLLLEFGQSNEHKLRNPFSVALGPAGDILVLDRPSRDIYRISLFSAAGEYQRTVLECQKGTGPTQLKFPKGIATDSRGNVYIPDAGNSRIQRFNVQGEHLGPLGSAGDGPGEFDSPSDVDIDDVGSLYVADTFNGRVQKLTPQGVPLLVIGSRPDQPTDFDVELDEPLGVTVDRQRNIYVADTNHHRIVKFDPSGKQVLEFGKEGRGLGEFSSPSDVRVTEDGVMFVADRENSRVQKFDAAGKALAEFCLEVDSQVGSQGGDVAIDCNGSLIICKTDSHTVAVVKLLDSAPPISGERP